MNEQYIKLLSLVALTASGIAEQVMEQNKKDGKLQEYGNSKKMRDNYLDIKAKLDEGKELDKNDFANLYIAAGLVTRQLEAKVMRDQQVVKAYQEDLMPKLLDCSKGKNPSEIFKAND